MNKKKITAVLALLALLTPLAAAHSGRTDAAGGHWDSSTGEYHYHHGYEAHQHENGICPYDPNYSAEENQSETVEPETSDSASGDLYNDGYGDDGTYETAYNLGYQHACEEFCDSNDDVGINFAELTTKLCHDNALVGSTPYSVRESSYNDAYESGWNQAADDVYSSINEALSQYVNGATQKDLLEQYQEGHAVGLEAGKKSSAASSAALTKEVKNLKLALGLAAALIVLLICGWLYAVKNVRRQISIFFRDMRTLARLSQDGTIKIDEINKILRSINEEQMK